MNINIKVTRNVERASKLFQEHADTIRNTITIHVNDKSSIDDIFQDFFLELVKKPVPENVKNVQAYLCRAVKNNVLDAALSTKSYHLRNRKYGRMHIDRFELPAPDDLAIHTEEIAQLFDIVKTRLHQYENKAVMQKYHHDRDTQQAAEAMGIQKRSFSRYLCTGMKKLQAFFCENQTQPDACGWENDAMI